MSLEYARKGLIGLLTPQANTTVEPEYNILLPAGYAAINGRLMSGKKTIEERLVDYFDTLESACAQFANAPVQAIAVACTGASYLAGREREAEVLRSIEEQHGIPAFTAATAVVDALRDLGAKRIALASPYPDSLTAKSVVYWESQGFQVTRVASSTLDDSQFHPIYSMKADSSAALLQTLAEDDEHPADAILMLGTGMPTLGPLLAANANSRVPVISCMLALAWKAVKLLDPENTSVRDWVRGTPWRARFEMQQS